MGINVGIFENEENGSFVFHSNHVNMQDNVNEYEYNTKYTYRR
jgi:hypothetical protein